MSFLILISIDLKCAYNVVDVSEPVRYRSTVTSANRESPEQRCETVTDYARLHNVRVDVNGMSITFSASLR